VACKVDSHVGLARDENEPRDHSSGTRIDPLKVEGWCSGFNKVEGQD
jgi:hypothetical protein